MLTGRTRLYTAAATVAMAAVTVTLMAAREYRAPAPNPAPRLTAQPAEARPAGAAAGAAAVVVAAAGEGAVMPAQAEDVAAPDAHASPLAGAPEAAEALPQLPRDPELKIASLEPDLHSLALKARVEELEESALPDEPEAPAEAAAKPPVTLAATTGEADRARNAYGIPCGPMLSAAPAPAGMIEMTVSAPCRGGEPVQISAGPLVFKARVDEFGTLKLGIPAMAETTPVEVGFADGEALTTRVDTAEAGSFQRVALLWEGAGSGLQIHALEFGARYGEPGHVWSGAPRAPDHAVAGRGGFLIRLGDESVDEPRLAEVYTYPLGVSRRDGVVRLSIEAEITPSNCERDVAGRTLQPGPDGALEAMEVTFAMPGCDAVGEFLVLKNLLRDLRLAAN